MNSMTVPDFRFDVLNAVNAVVAGVGLLLLGTPLRVRLVPNVSAVVASAAQPRISKGGAIYGC